MSKPGHVMRNLVEADIGQIPQQVINDKYRESCYFHDPEAIKNYQMDVLKVFSTDKPFTEQDRIRENSQSRNIIDLRIKGSRYGTSEPDHSEINFELTEKDPRGVYNLPKFDQARHHAEFRKRKWEYQFAKDGGINYTEKRVDPYEEAEKNQEMRHRWKQHLTIFNRARTDNPRSVHAGYHFDTALQCYVSNDIDEELLKKYGEKAALPAKAFSGNSEPKFGMGTVVDHHMTESGIGLLRQVKLYEYRAPITDADVDNKFMESMTSKSTRAKVISMKNLMRLKKTKGLTGEDIRDITTTGTLSHNKMKLLTDEEKKELKLIKHLHDQATTSMRDGRIAEGRRAEIGDFDIRKADSKITEEADRSSGNLTMIRKNKLFEKTKSDIDKSEIKLYGRNKETINYGKKLQVDAYHRAKHFDTDENGNHINMESNNVSQRNKLVERSRNNYDITEVDESGFYTNHGNRHGMSYASGRDGSSIADYSMMEHEDEWKHG